VGYWGPTVGLVLGLRRGQAQHIKLKMGLTYHPKYIWINVLSKSFGKKKNIYIYIYIYIERERERIDTNFSSTKTKLVMEKNVIIKTYK